MSALLIAAGVAVGTTFALLSLAYAAAASAHHQQALLDEETAKLWARAPRSLAPAMAVRPTPRRRAPVPASYPARGRGAEPGLRRAAGGRRH